MDLNQKCQHAAEVIEQVLSHYKKPVLALSGGKDSVLMLWMVREWFTHSMPIFFVQQPYFPRKYAYVHRLIADWNLDVYSDIPPFRVDVSHGNGRTEVVNSYATGNTSLRIPIGWVEPDFNDKWLCGRDKLLERPLGAFVWPWDCMFIGHKSSDIDPLLGPVKIDLDINQDPGGCDIAFPIRHFTDEDVAEMFVRNNIPQHVERYEVVDGKFEKRNGNHYDSDYFPYCNRCFDPSGPKVVDCPKTGLKVRNISNQITITNPAKEVGYISEI
jgi:3'-phosphoadenosine 5'-phosphosulfate sulfotransferase (PAPS reductase)/FAD synthetase